MPKSQLKPYRVHCVKNTDQLQLLMSRKDFGRKSYKLQIFDCNQCGFQMNESTDNILLYVPTRAYYAMNNNIDRLHIYRF